MSRQEAPPFGRGGTYASGGTTDAAMGFNLLGKEWVFEDVTYGTNQYVYCRAVRNTGAAALLPGRLCSFDTTSPQNAINGYTATTGAPGAILDEQLPAAGLAVNDVGWVIMEGPTLAYTPLDAGADNVINAMDPLAAITAATSGATTSGRVATISSATTNTRDSLLNVIGHAISAATTANTNKQILINAHRWL